MYSLDPGKPGGVKSRSAIILWQA